MPVLPVGFFMPLPLPIMIPFMMWQSAAIAAGFGTYFQFAKRKVSAMSNEEFNKADPHELVEQMYADIVQAIPSSFDKVDSLTPIILQHMNIMLDQAVKWLSNVITGNIFGTPSQPSLPSDEGGVDQPSLELISLSLSEISAANDLVLANWIKNINDYHPTTQAWLLAEQNRRGEHEPIVEQPSPEQQSTKLTPSFIASLSKKDLKQSGKPRTRIYKGVNMKWIVTHWIVWVTTTNLFSVKTYSGNSWSGGGTGTVNSLSAADSKVNALKRAAGASYVVEFLSGSNHEYFIIKDQ